jgi:hypothetical protein
MALQAEFVVDFPTLWVAADWVQAHCIVPDRRDEDGDHQPFVMYDWQLWALLNFYRVKPGAQVGQLAPAFHYRRSQIVLPQKAGKSPYTAAHVCVEAVGPALFAGWAQGGEVWDCRDHGCGCGWWYEYRAGEAMGRQWGTLGSTPPLIQITAYSEEQTDNVYDALRPMIDQGPLHELIPKTGEEFIRLPGRGRIDVVTSSAQSRLGQRVTFVPQDETGIWTAKSGMVKVARTQRRGLAGMGGRAEETTNAWDPNEDSVAQQTAESKVKDIFRLHPQAPRGLSYKNKAERRKIHRRVYAGCEHVDLDSIEADAVESLERDPGEAERWYGNRVVAGQGHAFNVDRWKKLADPDHVVPDGALVVVFVDGARFDDALAMIATHVVDENRGFQWPLGIWEVPANAPDDYEHPDEAVDGALVDVFERFRVWRVYVDPQRIEHLLERWQNRWGADRVVAWRTNRPQPIAWAVRNYTDAQIAGTVTHDGDAVFTRHMGNAVKQMLTVRDDKRRLMWTISKDRADSPNKMDGAMAGVGSWECRGDAVAAGALEEAPEAAIF